MLSLKTISTGLSRWHLHPRLVEKERLSRTGLTKEFHTRWNAEMTVGLRSREGYTRKWIWRLTREVPTKHVKREAECSISERAARIISSLPSFFSPVSAHPSRSIFHSFARTWRGTCFHSKHSQEASPCNNTTVNTKGTRSISSRQLWRIFLSHSLSPSSFT